MWWRNGWNVKDNGCIYNLFLIQEISVNNCHLKVKNSGRLIMFGKPICNSQSNMWVSCKCVLLMAYFKNLEMLMKNYNRFKNHLTNIYRKRDKSLLGFISFQTMIYLKFFLKQSNLQLYSLTWRKSLKIFMRFNLTTKR